MPPELEGIEAIVDDVVVEAQPGDVLVFGGDPGIAALRGNARIIDLVEDAVFHRHIGIAHP